MEDSVHDLHGNRYLNNVTDSEHTREKLGKVIRRTRERHPDHPSKHIWLLFHIAARLCDRTVINNEEGCICVSAVGKSEAGIGQLPGLFHEFGRAMHNIMLVSCST